MAITKIAGELLESNLIRSTDLAFNGQLLYLDVQNGRIGVNTNTPGNFALDVSGNTRISGNQTVTGDLIVQGTTTSIDSQNLSVEDNILTINQNASADTDSGIMINRGSSQDPAVFFWDETEDKFKFGTTTSDGSTRTDLTSVTLQKIQIGEPTSNSDAATKNYIDNTISTLSSSGTITGANTDLGAPVDSTYGDGALTTIGNSTKITEAVDGLNETMENIRNSTYVKSVTFTANTTSISEGDTVTLTITTVGGGANRYTITWGDGDSETVTTTSPTHVYDDATNTPMDVTVKAFNNTATTDSAGSFATFTRTDYIAVATPAPAVAFAIRTSATRNGGSAITKTDSGSTVFLQNNTTNSVSACTYSVDWGDGTTESIANNNAAGGGAGNNLSHTYTNSATDDGSTVAGTGAGDTKYNIRLTLLSHPSAAPEQIPQSTNSNFEVYSTHTPKIDIADSTLRGVNEEGTSGFPRTFINGTDTNPGANSSFSATQQYQWDFTDDSTQTTVNIGTGSSGDTDQTISKTFGFTQSGSGTVGSTTTYPVKLVLNNGHSTGTFTSAITNIVVEPDVRAVLTATTPIVSTKSGDNGLDLYDVTDLDGANRALVNFTNSSQNGDNYEYDFLNDSSDVLSIGEDGSTAGVVGVNLSKNFTGTSTGSFTTDFRATGTPDTIHQNDNETITFTMNATPSAPANLSTKSLTLSDSAQGTSPKLCHGFTDNSSSFTSQSAGDSLNTTTARRYTSGTIDTNTCTNFLTNNSNGTGSTVNQTVTAKINNADRGNRTFTTSEGGSNNATFTSLVVTNHRDADEVASFPQRMFLVATAKITQALSTYSIGSNAQRIESTAGGNTNIVHVVRDDVTATPTTTIGTVSQSSAGSLRYISGVPYYNTGSPTLQVSGTTIANFTGQAFQDTNSPHQVHNDTNQESTSGDVITDSAYTYTQVDGSTTMLSGSTPKVDIGVSSAYTIGNLSVPITSDSVRAVKTIRARSKNANGTGSYNSSATKIQVYRASLLSLDNEAGGITVSDSLGATFDDDAVRIAGFGSLNSDTPSLFDSSNANYYTDSAWSGAVTVAGTNEAISRFGTISHFTTDLSSGYLPVGPDLNTGRNGGEAQYFTFAFRRSNVANFNVTMSGKVSGMFIAAPGTAIDNASGLNGWLDCSTTYGGSGVPGSNTGAGGNGSNGCAFNSGDRVVDGTTYSGQEFTFTLGTENGTNATGNNILVRIKLNSGDSVTALAID